MLPLELHVCRRRVETTCGGRGHPPPRPPPGERADYRGRRERWLFGPCVIGQQLPPAAGVGGRLNGSVASSQGERPGGDSRGRLTNSRGGDAVARPVGRAQLGGQSQGLAPRPLLGRWRDAPRGGLPAVGGGFPFCWRWRRRHPEQRVGGGGCRYGRLVGSVGCGGVAGGRDGWRSSGACSDTRTVFGCRQLVRSVGVGPRIIIGNGVAPMCGGVARIAVWWLDVGSPRRT